LEGTIRDNLLLMKQDATDEEMYRALELAYCTFINLLPQKLDSLVQSNGTACLSGG